MAYSDFLAKTIKESGYSLRSIASICEKKYNVKITASYLSKLQKGGQSPASAKVNEAIAKVCRINPDDLLFEAELERAPEMIKKLVNDLIKFLKDFIASTINDIPLDNEDIKASVEEQLDELFNLSNRAFVKSMFEEENNINPFDFNSLSNGMSLNPSKKDDNLDNLFMKFTVGVKMLDDSMFPTIRQGSKIELIKLEEYENGDIVAVETPENENLIRTYIKSGNNVILIPDNKDFKTLTFNRKDIKIKGKVKSCTIDF